MANAHHAHMFGRHICKGPRHNHAPRVVREKRLACTAAGAQVVACPNADACSYSDRNGTGRQAALYKAQLALWNGSAPGAPAYAALQCAEGYQGGRSCGAMLMLMLMQGPRMHRRL